MFNCFTGVTGLICGVESKGGFFTLQNIPETIAVKQVPISLLGYTIKDGKGALDTAYCSSSTQICSGVVRFDEVAPMLLNHDLSKSIL